MKTCSKCGINIIYPKSICIGIERHEKNPRVKVSENRSATRLLIIFYSSCVVDRVPGSKKTLMAFPDKACD
jgi:hypothetical protein